MRRTAIPWTVALAIGPLPSLLAQGGPDFPTYAPPIERFVGLAPVALGAGDFDGDGLLDLAAGASVAATVTVALGTAPGGLGATFFAFAGAPPSALTVADFDLDGRLDVAVANGGLTILVGDGTGQLAAGTTFLGPGVPVVVASGDLDGNGLPDLIASTGSGNTVEVHRNVGALGFAPPQVLAVIGTPTALTVADFGNDGFPDVAVAATSAGVARILKNDGAGTLSVSSGSSAAFGVDSLAHGDFDADGFVDLAGSASLSNAVSFLRNNGAGGFTSVSASVGAALGPYGVAQGDVNGDGRSDVILARAASSDVRVFLCNSDGFPGWSSGRTTLAPPRAVLAADFTNDGRADLVVGHEGFSTVALYASFAQQSHAVGNGPRSLDLADLDGDGVPDAACANELGASVSVLRGNGAGGFVSAGAALAVGSGASALALGDLNHDGKVDLVVGGPTGFQARPGNGALGFGPAVSYLPAAGDITSLVLGDLDADGHLDAVATIGSTGWVTILPGNGAGGVSTPAGILTPQGTARAVALSDLNVDGALDLAVAEFAGGVTVLSGNGLGGFGAPAFYTTLNGAGVSASTGDLDGDGRPDLVLGEQYAITPLIQQPGGAFVAAPPIATPGFSGTPLGPPTVLVTDLDGDGAADLTAVHSDEGVANLFPFGISFFRNAGSGAFASPERFAEGVAGVSLRASDTNGDGRVDLLFCDPFTDGVAHLPNLQAASPGTVAYGAGTAGCEGILGVASNSTPVVGNLGHAIVCTNAPASTLGLLLVGNAADLAGSDPIFLNALLHIDLFASTELFALDCVSDANGIGRAAAPIVNVPQLAGLAYYVQAVWFWPSAECTRPPWSVVTSRGMTVAILP